MRKSIVIVFILCFLSCTKKKEVITDRKIDSLATILKKEDLITIKENKKNHLIDSLSDKEYSRVKLFLDRFFLIDSRFVTTNFNSSIFFSSVCIVIIPSILTHSHNIYIYTIQCYYWQYDAYKNMD